MTRLVTSLQDDASPRILSQNEGATLLAFSTNRSPGPSSGHQLAICEGLKYRMNLCKWIELNLLGSVDVRSF